ncbi:MAG: hypothetical protein ACLP59_14730 [Bryobacteraceae bacterium]
MRFTLLTMMAAAGAALLTGCAPAVSIHPFYTSQDLVSDPSLEGTWADQDDDVWRIQKADDGYNATVFHTGGTPDSEAFNIHLLRLKDIEFVDAVSQSNPSLAVSGHFIAKVSLRGDRMLVNVLDDDWLKKAAQSGIAPQSIVGEENGRIILTASSADLRRFVVQHAADADAWDSGTTFHRVH